MAIRRCNTGEHTYDDSQHSSCPYCRKTRLAMPPGGIASDNMDIPPPFAPPFSPAMQNKTTPAPGMAGGHTSGGSKTRVVFGGGETADFDEVLPVVGWLVIINGKGVGHDLRIVPGMNHIGRDKGELLLNFGDASISREKHARLAYDADDDSFLLAHLDGKNLTKVNGKTVMDTYTLKANDRIRMGETELLFVPLCGQHFSWDRS